jgi:DNA-binding beta-propeller fold protein YncE
MTIKTIGNSDFQFEANAAWARKPEGVNWLDVVAVHFTAENNVYVYNRGDREMIYFDSQGNYLGDWGDTNFARPHGLTISPTNEVFCTDDFAHTVTKYDLQGNELLTLGIRGQKADTGAIDVDYRNIKYSAGPFNYPTNLALTNDGGFYVSDGYGNARIHQFTSTGEHIRSWGDPGTKPSQFAVPHDLRIADNGELWVADRENDRIQIFSPEGEFIRLIDNLARPASLDFGPDGEVYVFELGYRAGMFPGNQAPYEGAPGGRLTVMNQQGDVLCQIAGGDATAEAGDFYAPHNVRVDANGDLYLTEVVWAAGGGRGLAPDGCPALQKLTRI